MINQGRCLSVLLSVVSVLFFSTHSFAVAEHIAGEYVVKLKSSVGVMGASSMQPMAASLNANYKSMVSSRTNTMVIQKSILERPDAVVAELLQNPMVEIVEPNYIYHALLKPNDSRMDDLWGLINRKKASGGVDIDAASAWDITTGSDDVLVAIIDTGVNYNDPDLVNNMWVNEAEKNGQPGVDDDGNGFVDDIHGYDFANNDGDPMDDNDHGSHCAGTIGAEGDNGVGVVGVNWRVKMMALKFLTNSGSGTLESAIQSIDYAREQGVDIMSNSWGGGGESQLLKEAIERAEQAGILFVAAAGNDRSNNDSKPSFPANYDVPNVISVAAIDSKGKLARFSNYGKTTVHVAAPGVNILSTGKNGLKKLSGTSMATPHVSGVAALLLASEPHLSYRDLRKRILRTSVPSNILTNKMSHGILNAYNALTNTVASPDQNDPSLWDQDPQALSSDHPYKEKIDQNFTLQVPGAEKVSVHFSRFETENKYDKVLIYDGQGNEVGEMTGNHDGGYSPVVEGDTIVLRLKSDYSVNKYGFDVDYVAYKGVKRDGWQSFVDPVSTNHPYGNNLNHDVVFKSQGASEIKIQFGQFETEKNYDFVYFYDRNGQELGRWDGDHSGEFSPVAQGDEIIVRIHTDYSVTRYGFDVEKIHYR